MVFTLHEHGNNHEFMMLSHCLCRSEARSLKWLFSIHGTCKCFSYSLAEAVDYINTSRH